MDDVKTLYDIIQLVGTPGVIALLLMRFARWLKPIVERLVDRHLEFVDEVKKAQTELCDNTSESSKKLTEIAHDVKSLNVQLTSVCKAQEICGFQPRKDA